jgi:hypothetical protein
MKWFKDIHGRQIRLTDEREEHIENDHPEMSGQIDKCRETLLNPDKVIRSRTDPEVELFYKYYNVTPVTKKFLCVVVKGLTNNLFIITTYFTDTVKRGELLWERK